MSEREWRFYIDDMIGFAERARAHTAGMDQAALTLNAMARDATLRNLELIGEAASHVPQSIRDSAPEIPCGRSSRRGTGSYMRIRASMTIRSGASPGRYSALAGRAACDAAAWRVSGPATDEASRTIRRVLTDAFPSGFGHPLALQAPQRMSD